MKSNKLTKLLLTLAACFLLMPTHAQVTIGSGEAPSRAALLEIKDQKPDAQNVTSTKGGLALPRVSLVNSATLEPFIATNDPDWTNATTQAELKTTHTGLMVYNLNATSPFTKGIYVWTGEKWAVASGLARNGLNEQDGYIQMGGTLLENTSIDMNGKTFDFTTKGQSFAIKGLEDIQTNATAVVVDVNTGRLGKAGVTPTRLTFAQAKQTTININSAEGQSGTLTEATTASNIANTVTNRVPGTNCTTSTTHPLFEKNLNWGKKVIVPFKDADIITNIDVTTPVYDNAEPSKIVAFELTGTYTVELTGYVNYSPNKGNAASDAVLLNLTVQVKADGETEWTDYSSVRYIMNSPQQWYRNTLNLPPAVYEGKKGDQVRLVIVRPFNIEGTTATFLGGAHGYGDNFKVVSIATPYGTQFSCGIKITAIG